MAQEIDIVDRVSVDVNGLGELDKRVAIAPATPLVVFYRNRSTQTFRRATVHGFNGSGEPLVVDGNRLIRAVAAARPDETVDSIRPEGPTDRRDGHPVGPFTPAPAGMTAVFSDATLPVAFYDVYGRACAIDRDPGARSLFVLEDDEGLVRIDGPSELRD